MKESRVAKRGNVFVRPFNSWEDAQNVLRGVVADLQDEISKQPALQTIINKTSTSDEVDVLRRQFAASGGGVGSEVKVGLHADRLTTAAYPDGRIFIETDRGVKYFALNSHWYYLSGYYKSTFSNKPTDLVATYDVGFLFEAADYTRVWRWTGSGWERAPGERPTREVVYTMGTLGTGWALCDGSTVTYTKDDASTASMTLPNESGVYRKGGTYSGTVNSAVAPTVTSTFTGTALSAHAHELPFAIDGGESPPDIDVIAESVFGTGTTRSTVYHANGNASVESLPVALSQAVSAGTPAGSVSSSAGTNGEPANVVYYSYMKL